MAVYILYIDTRVGHVVLLTEDDRMVWKKITAKKYVKDEKKKNTDSGRSERLCRIYIRRATT